MSKKSLIIKIVCSYEDRVPAIMALFLFFGILLSFSLLYLEPGTASYTIALFDSLLVLAGFIIFGGIFWFCSVADIEDK